MTYDGALGIVADGAATLPAAIAVWGYGSYRRDHCTKQSRLEIDLKTEKAEGKDRGQHSVRHLIANLGMSESDVLDAACRSRNIRRVTTEDVNGFADLLLLEYAGD